MAHTSSYVDGGVNRADLIGRVSTTTHVEAIMAVVLRSSDRPNKGRRDDTSLHLETCLFCLGGEVYSSVVR